MAEAEEPAPVVRRFSALLVASLGVSGLTLLVPGAFGPLGPVVAGILALVGYRAVRKSGGLLRGPGLAAIAMTAALVLAAVMGWNMVRSASTAAAWTQIRAHVARVEGTLRTGTAEGAWALLSEEARAGLDQAAFLREMRGAMTRMGPLESLGEAKPAGGDWERTAEFEKTDPARLRLGFAVPGRFRGGRATVRISVLVRREGGKVTSSLTEIRVEDVSATAPGR